MLRALLLAVLLAAAAPAVAADRIQLSQAQLKAMDVDPQKVALGAFSDDGSVLVCFEKERDPKRIARGQVYTLRVLRIDWNSGKVTADSMSVPTTELEQLALSPDNRQVFII